MSMIQVMKTGFKLVELDCFHNLLNTSNNGLKNTEVSSHVTV